jgi:mycothiol synthase
LAGLAGWFVVTANLPAGWTVRPPTLDDVPAILAVVHASDIAAVGEPDFTTDEVVEILTGPGHDPRRDSWVAVDDTGRLVGWAYVTNTSGAERDTIDDYVHPDGGTPAQGHLLDLALARVRERVTELGHKRMTVRAGAIASETHYIGLLRDAGFDFVKRYARMRRDLAGDEVAPTTPAGVTIRAVRADDDAEMRAFFDILSTSFTDLSDNLTVDYDGYRAQLTAMPSISWDEWFVAEVDAWPAGILQSADTGIEDNEGWVRYLAVARDFRGRGLGALLLRTAFAAYAAKGRTTAGLGVDMTNPTGAYRLYESVGMRPVYEADMYERTIEG